jgi:DNA-binding HxlR family transcriptional regulator
MRRGAKEPRPCPIHELLEVLARPWTMHILWTLSTNGPTRFGALRRQVQGISSRVLTERLRILEQRGFVFRDYEPTIPPSVTYGITSRMKDIGKVLDDLNELGKKWQQEDAHLRTKLGVDKAVLRHSEFRHRHVRGIARP